MQLLSSEFQYIALERVSSTMDSAAALVSKGMMGDYGALHAQHQENPRGRQGRMWNSGLPGKGLAVTLIFKLSVPLNHVGELAFVAAVGLHQALQPCLTQPLVLKWPNDLLINSRKVGGVLIEVTECNGCWATIGIGLNMLKVPNELQESAECLGAHWKKDCQYDLDEEILFAVVSNSILECFKKWQAEGFRHVKDYWERHTLKSTEMLHFHAPSGEAVRGFMEGITDQGALIIRGTSGEKQIFNAGDLIVTLK